MNIDQKTIQEAGEILKKGGLVAFPTETVYGLGANALDEEAARKTYAAKGRPSDNPLIVHICEVDALNRIAVNIPEEVGRLAEKFWPGPLTLILEKSDEVPYGTTGGLDTVAVRMPSDSIARELIRAAGGYVSAPSANTSGRPSPTAAEHVREDLDGKIEMILDGGSLIIFHRNTDKIPVYDFFQKSNRTSGCQNFHLRAVIQQTFHTSRMIRLRMTDYQIIYFRHVNDFL